MESTEGRSFAGALRRAAIVAAVVWPALIFGAESAPKTESSPKAAASVSDELARFTKEAYEAKDGTKKRDALVELASLRELSGDIEGAAAAWTDAAFASEAERDDPALLEAARCLIALGELDQAFADLRTVLITGRDARAVKGARYLAAQISAFRGDEDAVEILSTFIDDPEYKDRRPATLYLLWRISSNESFLTRLLADHGTSPEAALADGAEPTRVSVARTPLWLFLNARGASAPGAGEPAPPGPVAASPAAADVSKSAQAVRPPTVPESSEKSVVLQIGLFRREENARALMKRLDAAGFKSELMKRDVGTDAFFAVAVSGGDDTEKTTLRLKDAGFESFPLY